MEKIFDIAKDSEKSWGVIAQGIDGNFEEIASEINDLSLSVNDKLNISDYCDESDYSSINIELNSGEFFNYKTLEKSANDNFSSIKIDDVKEGDMYRFVGIVAYSALAAVIYVDGENNVMGYLYGDNTSAHISFDTGIIKIPIGCTSVIFEAYTADIKAVLTKYTLPKTMTESRVNAIVDEKIYPNDDYISISPEDIEIGYYYNGNTGKVVKTALANTCCASLPLYGMSKVSFNGYVKYGSIYGITFADDDGNVIGDRIGHSQTGEAIDTGMIDIPNGATMGYFSAYSTSFIAKTYTRPAIITELDMDKYVSDKKRDRYINAYHYIFGVTSQDDIITSGFNTDNYEASTNGAFIVHDKYFRSYKRKIEWRVELNASTILSVGTGNTTTSIVVNSRQTQYKVDGESSLLRVYKESGSQFDLAALGILTPNTPYIIRLSQYDYEQTLSVINERTLEVIGTYTYLATPQESATGKLLGRPFLKLESGYVKVLSYDVYLMDSPEFLFVGDSITECGYRQNTYAAMFIDNDLNGDGCIIAQGGATIDALASCFSAELPFMKPKYLSLLGGTNGSISDVQISSWKSVCDNIGTIFILNRIPVSEDPNTHPWKDKNEIIRASGIRGANFDFATSLNNNPEDGADASLFGDTVHPNASGQKKMYERFVDDIQYI